MSPFNKVTEVVVTEASAEQRIDNFLLRQLKGVPRSHIYRILRRGEVRVNRGRIRPEHRLQTGDVIRIPPIRVAESVEHITPADRVLRQIKQCVIYEDSRLLVLDKPAGLAVHGGSGIRYGIIEALRALRPNAPFLELGHRLDRDTSGCLVVAKRSSALRAFQKLLREGEIKKIYYALVKGCWRGERISAPLRKNVLRSGERIVRVSEDGKPSVSLFAGEAVYREASLMRVRLLTGRTHQVRAHAQHSGHPVAGDGKYGDEAFNRVMQGFGLRRLFLHAAELSFHLPGDEQEISVSVPLDEHLTHLLDRLK